MNNQYRFVIVSRHFLSRAVPCSYNAVKVAERNINVNVIVPGVTPTQAWNRLAKKRGLPDESKMLEGIVERLVPMKQPTMPSDIGNTVAFLSSKSGRFITGTVLPVDGGIHLIR